MQLGDPLSTSKIVSFNKESQCHTNKRGRPTYSSIKRFCPEPQSSVSKILRKKYKDKHATNLGITADICATNVKNVCKPIRCNSQNEKTEPAEEIKIDTTSKGDLEHSQSTKGDCCYYCDYSGCNYFSKLMSNITKHKRIHTNDRPYFCDHCDFRSNFVNSLKVHKRIHSNFKPYCCEQCGHRCNSISNLKKHCLHKH